MQNFFTTNLWFGQYPGPLTPFFSYILYALMLAFAVYIVIAKLNKKKAERLYQNFWQSIMNFSVTGLIIGLLLWFFTSQTIRFFNMRVWFLVWILFHIIWGYTIYKRYQKLPAIAKEIEAKKEFNKYVP